MSAGTVAERLEAVRRRLHAAAVAAGRDPAEVKLVAVSKTWPMSHVQPVLDAGQVDLGESYAQELRDKAREVRTDTVRWHFVGRLQRNKAKYIAPVAFRVHALTGQPEAEALVKRAPAGVDALLAVNIGREPQKSGILPEALMQTCEALSGVEGLRLRGLMCLPPAVADPEEAAPYFEELADLASRGRAAGFALHELSMGMSADAHVAVAHGATWVRVGTAIFGRRQARA